MKSLYLILTILLWITLVLALFMIIVSFGKMPNMQSHLSVGYILGSIGGAGSVPGIIWVIRYFVGKSIGK